MTKFGSPQWCISRMQRGLSIFECAHTHPSCCSSKSAACRADRVAYICSGGLSIKDCGGGITLALAGQRGETLSKGRRRYATHKILHTPRCAHTARMNFSAAPDQSPWIARAGGPGCHSHVALNKIQNTRPWKICADMRCMGIRAAALCLAGRPQFFNCNTHTRRSEWTPRRSRDGLDRRVKLIHENFNLDNKKSGLLAQVSLGWLLFAVKGLKCRQKFLGWIYLPLFLIKNLDWRYLTLLLIKFFNHSLFIKKN